MKLINADLSAERGSKAAGADIRPVSGNADERKVDGMSKCERCVHKNICKHEKEMKKFEAEIVEKTRLIEYAEFTAKVECKHYCEEKPIFK